MAFLTYETVARGDTVRGLFRTLALAQAQVAANANYEALTDEVAREDIPADADTDGNWFIVTAPAIARVDAAVEIRYGTSGKGFRLVFSAGALGAAGNGWTVTTGGTTISFDADAMTVELPEPIGLALDYLAMLTALSGTYQFTADYIAGTEGATDLSAIGSATWQAADGGTPEFAGGADAIAARKIVTDVVPPAYSPRAQAALALLTGLHTFREFVLEHAEGVPESSVEKVNAFLRQKRRTVRMVYENNVTIGGNTIALTDAQFIAWATFCRLGPLDTSAVTALGEYNPEGLFEIFERANDSAILTPTGPITWVGLDVTQWTGGYPNRLNVAEIAPVLGTAPSQYLNVDNLSWLRSDA